MVAAPLTSAPLYDSDDTCDLFVGISPRTVLTFPTYMNIYIYIYIYMTFRLTANCVL